VQGVFREPEAVTPVLGRCKGFLGSLKPPSAGFKP
jgi:hypothetical protein